MSPVVIVPAALVIAVAVAACTDRSASTEPAQRFARGVATAQAACPSAAALEDTVNAVFIKGSPNAQAALGKLGNMVKQYSNGDIAGAQDQARNIIRFVRLKWSELARQELIPGLIDGLECFTGITSDSYIVVPSTEQQTLVTDSGEAGMLLPPSAVSEPTLITFDVLPAPPALPGDFMLDVYDRFVNVTQESGVANSLLKPVTVAVCPVLPGTMSVEAKTHLRLGHWASAAFETAGFEVTPRAANVSFMPCAIAPTGVTGSGGLVGSLLRTVRSYFADEVEAFSGGVGGTAGSFSPFGVVDDQLLFSGGVGGTAGSFLRAAPDESGAAPDATQVKAPATETSTQWTSRAPAKATAGEGVILFQTAGECTTGVVATAVSPLCRPGLKLTTRLGKPVVGLSVTFTIGAGEGKTALEPCDGAIDAVAVTATTNEFGKAGACWTLGAKGTNTITAAVTGGLPVGVHLTQDLLTWTMTAKAPTITTVTCEPTMLTYTGADRAPCTAQTSDGTSVVAAPDVVYQNNRNVGEATATATFAGDAHHNASTGTATFMITKAPSTTTVSFEPGPYVYRASAFTATAAVLGAGDVTGTAVITYSGDCLNVTANGCTATAVYAGDLNHEASADTLSVTIKPTPATITARDAVMTYGEPLPALTADITGVLRVDALNYTLGTTASATAGAGAYPITVSLGTNLNYSVTTVPATLTIAKRPLTATAWSGGMLLGGVMPAMPCVVTNLATDTTPACTTGVVFPVVPGTNITTPQVWPSSPDNYTWTRLVNGVLQVSFVQVGCFSSPIYSVMPPTKSAQRKGSNVPVKCGLFDANGNAVVTATGNLRVEDRGTDSLTAPSVPGTQAFPDDPATLFGVNVFSASKGGNYSFGLDTSSPKFLAGHYYYVIARWSDGSRTEGWFLLK